MINLYSLEIASDQSIGLSVRKMSKGTCPFFSNSSLVKLLSKRLAKKVRPRPAAMIKSA